MPGPDNIRILVYDNDPNAIEDFRIVLGQPRDSSDGSDAMGVAFEAALIGSCRARGRFPDLDLTVESSGHKAIEVARRAIARGRAFRIAFIDMGAPPGCWGLDIAAALRALDPKLHIVLTISEPGPNSVDLSERVAPADFLSLLRKPLHAPEIELLILSAETRHARQKSGELACSQARDIAARALRDLPIALIVAEQDRRIVVAAGAVPDIFPDFRGGLVPGTYLPDALAWIVQPDAPRRKLEETDPSREVRELRLDGGRCVVAASARSPGGGGMGLFLDITDQKRERARLERHAQTTRMTANLTAIRRAVNALLREHSRPPGRPAANAPAKTGAGGGMFADRLQGLIEQLDAALAAPAGPEA